MKRIPIAVDFDGTIVAHEFPHIGAAVPGAFHWMKAWQEAGANLILWTMRSDGRVGNGKENGPVLTEAVEFCQSNGIEFWSVNENPRPEDVDSIAQGVRCNLYRRCR